MTRLQLEHVIRAAGAVTNLDDMIVIGSQCILGQYPEAPAELLLSMEADLYPRDEPEMSVQIDGAIGENSPFHETFGYYGHGVHPDTAILPEGWESRLIPVKNENTRGVTGWCLEAHDLAFSKWVAGREKDQFFVRSMLKREMIKKDQLLSLINKNVADSERRILLTTRLNKQF